MEQIVEQAFQQYGLVGLIVGFLVSGPGYTYIKTRNMHLKVENRAHELLQRYLQEERTHAAQLETRLEATLEQLEISRQEVFALTLKLNTAEHKLEAMSDLSEQVAALTRQVAELEELTVNQADENARLRDELATRIDRIRELEALLVKGYAPPTPEAS